MRVECVERGAVDVVIVIVSVLRLEVILQELELLIGQHADLLVSGQVEYVDSHTEKLRGKHAACRREPDLVRASELGPSELDVDSKTSEVRRRAVGRAMRRPHGYASPWFGVATESVARKSPGWPVAAHLIKSGADC